MPNRTTTVVEGGAVITVDEDRRVLDPGGIVVEEDRIVAVDELETIRNDYSADVEIDATHAVLLPGLVDTHGHAGHSLTKGLGVGSDDGWMGTVQSVYFHASTEEFWEAESYLSALEHLEMGVTTSLSFPGSSPRTDDPKYAIAAAEGFADLGLRHIVNIGPPNPPYPKSYTDARTGTERKVSLDDAIDTTATVIDTLDGTEEGRLSVYIGPSSLIPEFVQDGESRPAGLVEDEFVPGEGEPSEASVEQLEQVVKLATTKETKIHTHAFGGQVEAAADVVPEALSPDLSLAHCSGLSAAELELMADNGVSASHGPLTHAYVRSRFPLIEALEAGVNVAISTDGSAPDRSFDLLSQGRIAAQLQRVHFNDTSLLPAGKVLEMMTIDAASALGMADEVGSLEPGKKADIIGIDLDSAKLRPRTSLVHRVANYASGADTEFVMVDGEVLMQNGQLRDVDADSILQRADKVAMETFERAGVLDMLEDQPNTWGGVRY
ncbi:amidohydrolase family protein (plasmid) [Haloferax prahovense]|uniref:amidohydrolase family protein n=1 Tax=Haloferax prahovense TaxID=381852 RepID=UPI003C742E85